MRHFFYKIISTLTILIIFIVFWNCAISNTRGDIVQPNILYIMSDDHTSQAWGIYGGILTDYVKNTNIKRLSNEGAILNNVFCTNSICVPSRATIMTGKYSHENGVYTLNDSLSLNQMSIAQLLRENGYETSIIGKWHLKELPYGFDYMKVLPGQGRYHNPIFRHEKNWNDTKNWETLEGFSADVIADESIKWLEGRKRHKPFFLMTHFKATHEPFDYPERHKNLYDTIKIPEPFTLMGDDTKAYYGQQLEILGRRYEKASADSSLLNTYPGLPIHFPDSSHPKERRSAIYQKFIKDYLRSGAAIDDNIGKLLQYLDDHNLSNNTIVIYTADQGYFLGEHGFFDKRIMYDEALKMPFIIRYPSYIKQGGIYDDFILNLDFASLFADYAGITAHGFGSGKSFRKILEGEKMDGWRDAIYYRYWQHLKIRPAHLGIRTKNYKLIYFYGKPMGKTGTDIEETEPFWEFYDLKNDPMENINEIGNPKFQSAIQELKLSLKSLKKSVGDKDSVY